MQKLRAEESPLATDAIYSLACGPDRDVNSYSGCIVNGIRFHTKDREANLKTQNSGVVVKGDYESQDKDFYGVLVDIIELEYIHGNRVFLFKCDWWDVSRRTGIHVDNHFTSVNVSKTWYKDDPFVLSTQARQVFYVNDTKLRGDWKVVQRIDPRNVYDVVEKEEENTITDSDDAYQQEEPQAVNGIVSHDQLQDGSNNEGDLEEATPLQLNRIDVTADKVDVNVVKAHMGRQDIEDTPIYNGENDEEDNTLMDYFSEEERGSTSNEDTDID